MLNRCRNQRNENWENYGGRGIAVCERWLSFESFLADMGRRPSKQHSLDRRNTNGNYAPDNCRWATAKVQQNNRRKMARIEQFDDAELLREVYHRALPALAVDGYLSFGS